MNATRVRAFEVAIAVRLFESVHGLLIEKLALFLASNCLLGFLGNLLASY
jgi:hypothetical protein